MVFLPRLRIAAFFRDTSSDFLSDIFINASPDLTQAKLWLILWNLWIFPDMLFFSVSICNACGCNENNHDRTRLGRVSQTVSVQCEGVTSRTTRPRVDDNLFDSSQRRGSQPSISASRSCLSHAYTLWGHESPNDAIEPKVLEAPKAQEEVVIDSLGGPFDTSLLHLYAHHAARHV